MWNTVVASLSKLIALPAYPLPTEQQSEYLKLDPLISTSTIHPSVNPIIHAHIHHLSCSTIMSNVNNCSTVHPDRCVAGNMRNKGALRKLLQTQWYGITSDWIVSLQLFTQTTWHAGFLASIMGSWDVPNKSLFYAFVTSARVFVG